MTPLPRGSSNPPESAMAHREALWPPQRSTDPLGARRHWFPRPCQNPQRVLWLLPRRGRGPLRPVCPLCLTFLYRLGLCVPVSTASPPLFGLVLGLPCPLSLVSVPLSLSDSALGPLP